MKNKFCQFLCIALISASGTAYSAFTQVINFTDTDNDFYTEVSNSQMKLGLDTRDIYLNRGDSAKIVFTLPPGVDLFYLKGMEVTSWSGQSGGAMYYAHSLENLSDARNYNLSPSTALGERIWLYGPGKVGQLTTTVSDKARKVYFVIKNNSGQGWKSFYTSIAMNVSDPDAYNAWINSDRPVSDTPSTNQNTGTTPPARQNTGTTPRQNTGTTPPARQNTGTTPRQNTGTTPRQNTGTTPRQNTGTTPRQNHNTNLSGLEKLSCETILCLSTGSPPHECDSALNYFYDLKEKKWKDTLKKRKNFLKICPSGTSSGMSGLINTIATGAGRCDRDYLLLQLNPRKNFDGEWESGRLSSIPAYCKAYYNHELTRLNTLPERSQSCRAYGSKGPIQSNNRNIIFGWSDEPERTVCLYYWY